MITSKFKWMRLTSALAMGLLALSPLAHVGSAHAAPPSTGIVCETGTGPSSFALSAEKGYIQMPDMNTMYMWSYGSGSAAGNFQHPGPTLCVNQNDIVMITLTNNLPYGQRTSLIFPGQDSVLANGSPAQPDLLNNSLTNSIPSGGSIIYSFMASRPGTFIYESGTDTKTQVPMGLFGALIVRPTLGANFVYNRSDSRFTPTEEFMALLSEVDPYQHQAWEVGLTQGMNYNLNNYRARYWMLNGRGFPDTVADNDAPWLATQPYGALARIYPNDSLLPNGLPNPTPQHPYPAVERFINVGSEEYPFHPHGQNGLVIGRDGNPLESSGGLDLSMEKFAVNIGPGQTWDTIFKWYDAEAYNPVTKPVPVTVPDLVNIGIGMFYSGSPYLGYMETMPPGTNTLNQCGEFYIISHNHALFQLDAFGATMAGPITYLRIDPPVALQTLTGNVCP